MAKAGFNRAVRLAKEDWVAARMLAEQVDGPAGRAYALAWVARHAADEAVLRVAREALAAARQCDEPFKVIRASVTPIAALVARGRLDDVREFVAELMGIAGRIIHPISRLDALFGLWEAAFPIGPEARAGLQDAVIEACRASASWRGAYTMKDMARLVGRDDPAGARAIVASMPDCRERRQAERAAAQGKWSSPRTFFW